MQDEEARRECSSQDKQDFLQYIFEVFPNGSPFVERELVGSIRVSRNIKILSFQIHLHLDYIKFRTNSMFDSIRTYSI